MVPNLVGNPDPIPFNNVCKSSPKAPLMGGGGAEFACTLLLLTGCWQVGVHWGFEGQSGHSAPWQVQGGLWGNLATFRGREDKKRNGC